MPPDEAAPEGVAAGEPARLQKVLAAAGVGSRRVCEELIANGRVTVDGAVATLGDKVDPATAVIHVDGARVVTDPDTVYLAFNKPRGVVSTMDDEWGRSALADYLDNVPARVFHVGRLDADSEGLLLLTNDGELAHRLTHPAHGVTKTYLCQVPGPVPRGVERALRSGVKLEDGPARADAFRVVDTMGREALVEVVLHEGRKHIVRRMLAQVGHPVARLVRTAVGPVRLGHLKPGQLRPLSRREVAALFAEAERESAAVPSAVSEAQRSKPSGQAAGRRGTAAGEVAAAGSPAPAGRGPVPRGSRRRGRARPDSA